MEQEDRERMEQEDRERVDALEESEILKIQTETLHALEMKHRARGNLQGCIGIIIFISFVIGLIINVDAQLRLERGERQDLWQQQIKPTLDRLLPGLK